jgi:hypothetical protein
MYMAIVVQQPHEGYSYAITNENFEIYSEWNILNFSKQCKLLRTVCTVIVLDRIRRTYVRTVSSSLHL